MADRGDCTCALATENVHGIFLFSHYLPNCLNNFFGRDVLSEAVLFGPRMEPASVSQSTLIFLMIRNFGMESG